MRYFQQLGEERTARQTDALNAYNAEQATKDAEKEAEKKRKRAEKEAKEPKRKRAKTEEQLEDVLLRQAEFLYTNRPLLDAGRIQSKEVRSCATCALLELSLF